MNSPLRVDDGRYSTKLHHHCTIPRQSLEVGPVSVDLSVGPCGPSPGITSEALDVVSKMGLSSPLSK
jgi:hypothetical protein